MVLRIVELTMFMFWVQRPNPTAVTVYTIVKISHRYIFQTCILNDNIIVLILNVYVNKLQDLNKLLKIKYFVEHWLSFIWQASHINFRKPNIRIVLVVFYSRNGWRHYTYYANKNFRAQSQTKFVQGKGHHPQHFFSCF